VPDPVVEVVPVPPAAAPFEREAPGGRRSSAVHRFFVLASIALIAAYWSALATLYARDVLVASFEHLGDVVRVYAVALVVEIAVVWVLLRGAGERFADLGLSFATLRDALRTRQVYLAAALLLILQPLVAVTYWWLSGTDPRPNPLAGSMTTENLPSWVLLSIFGGGFREELERAFCITRFERGFGTMGLVAAILVDAVIFGRGHWHQGTVGMITTGVMAIAFSLVYLRRRRVADAMVAHAALDLIVVFALYARPPQAG
jgi:membrane protease YdiL (CAAX protease family)